MLGSLQYQTVTWTVGDYVTEAKMDDMVGNDKAYDSHADQGYLSDNNRGFWQRDNGNTIRRLLNLDSGNVLQVGDDDVQIKLNGSAALMSDTFRDSLFLKTHPVGSVYISVLSTNPGTLFGGTWVSLGAGRTLVGFNAGDADFNAGKKTGGAKTHTLTIAQMPTHSHTQNAHSHSGTTQAGAMSAGGTWGFGTSENNVNGIRAYNITNSYSSMNHTHGFTTNNATATNQNTGGGAAHNNLQPYITVYMFERTA